jgi:acetyl esterase/lipase
VPLIHHDTSRVFFPKDYDQSSTLTLPALFSIHGGGFAIGNARGDDDINRHLADSQNIIVIALGYSKAPQHPFPTGIYDLEAVILAVLDDESLPITRVGKSYAHSVSGPSGAHNGMAKGQGPLTAEEEARGTKISQTAILGFSAGGNLAMAVAQLPSLRSHSNGPRAAISVYGPMDVTLTLEQKMSNRPYKPELSYPGNATVDFLAPLAASFDWGYVPYGADRRNKLLSPLFALKGSTRREGAEDGTESLPPFLGFVAGELDMLAFENWEMACRAVQQSPDVKSGKRQIPVPDRESKDKSLSICGTEEPSPEPNGKLRTDDTRFAFEETWDEAGETGTEEARKGDGTRGVKWLLVPDVVHSFDNAVVRLTWRNNVSAKDAEAKTIAYVDELGRWLRETVWKIEY